MIKIPDYLAFFKDFPQKGITFCDVSPLLANPEVFRSAVQQLATLCRDADVIVSPDARGFLFGPSVALANGVPFVMARKSGKLPGHVISQSYNLEYGDGVMTMQDKALRPGAKVVIVDDILATGGTAIGIIELVKKYNAQVTSCLFVASITSLKAATKIKAMGVAVQALVEL